MDVDSALPCPTAAPLPSSTSPSEGSSAGASTSAITNDAGSFAQVLLDGAAGSTRNLRRLGAGFALSAVFGLAIGARYGLASMAVHAAGVPSARASA